MAEQTVIAGQNLLFLNVLVGIVLFFAVAFVLKAFVLNKHFYIWLYRNFRQATDRKNTDLLTQFANLAEQLESNGYRVQYSVTKQSVAQVQPQVKPQAVLQQAQV